MKVNVHEAKTHFSRLLDRALAGEEVIVMKSGRPLVKLVPVEGAPAPRTLGSAKGDFVTPADFNAPLPEGVLAEFKR